MMKYLVPLEMLMDYLKSNQGSVTYFALEKTLVFVTEYWIEFMLFFYLLENRVLDFSIGVLKIYRKWINYKCMVQWFFIK